MIKIIHILPLLNDGGAETLIKDYATLIDRKQFQIKVVVSKNVTNTANYTLLRREGIEIIPLYKRENIFIKLYRKIFFKLDGLLKLKKLIIQENPNVIHAHLGFLEILGKLSKTLKQRNIKIVYTCHNLPELIFKGNGEYKGAKTLLKKNNLQLVALHADMKNELDELFNIKSTVVLNNGINFNRFMNINEKKNDIRIQNGIPENSFVIGHVGRFVEQKNHVFLIDIFYKIYQKNKNAFLLLVGDGPLKKSVILKIEYLGIRNRVLILSNRTDIPQLLKAMDVFVFPSLFEGLGIVVVEALASGLRCIVSDRVPKAAYLNRNVIPLSLEEKTDKWLEAICNSQIFSDYENKLYEYDMNVIIGKLENLYRETL